MSRSQVAVATVDSIAYQCVMCVALLYFALRNVANAVDNGEISGGGVVYTVLYALFAAWHFSEWRRKRAFLAED